MNSWQRFLILSVCFLSLISCAGKKTGMSGDMGSGAGSSMSGNNDMNSMDSKSDGMDDSGMMGSMDTSPVYFEYDQSNLSSTARSQLKKMAQDLNKNDKNAQLLIEGHCDNRGTTEYNLALGERRAKTIKDYLINLGVASKRLSTISYGEEKPAVPGEDENAWSKNRRGEFVISGR